MTPAHKADAERFLLNGTLRYHHLFPELDKAIALPFDRSFIEATQRRAIQSRER